MPPERHTSAFGCGQATAVVTTVLHVVVGCIVRWPMRLCVLLTRALVLGDIIKLAKALRAALLRSPGGGLQLRPGEGVGLSYCKVTFHGCGHFPDQAAKHNVFALGPTGFRYGDSVVWAVRKYYSKHTARMWVTLHEGPPGSRDPEHAREIIEAVAAAFDARPARIHNRHAIDGGPNAPLPDDSAEDVNDFYGCDMDEALQQFTRPSRDHPEFEAERVLRCWRCRRWLKAWEFRYPDAAEWGPMAVALVNLAHGHRRVCTKCETDVLYQPTAHMPPKRGTAKFVSRKAKKTVLEVQKCVECDLTGAPTYHHIGYMDRLYDTMAEAVADYNAHNEHMSEMRVPTRSEAVSECDPKTKLRYIVRRCYGDTALNLPGF